MRLTHAIGDFDQRCLVEPLRFRQQRAGDFDHVVEGEGADGEQGCRVDRGKAIGKQHLGRCLDMSNHELEHFVEQFDLLAGKIRSAADEEVGHPAQGIDPLRDVTVCKGRLQFVEQTLRGGSRIHVSILERSGMPMFVGTNEGHSINCWQRCGCVPVLWLRRGPCRRARAGYPASRSASWWLRPPRTSRACSATARSSRGRRRSCANG